MFYIHAAGWYICGPQYDIRRGAGNISDFQLKYIVKGSGFVTCNQVTYKVKQGQIFLLDLNSEHRYFSDPNDPWELLWVHFGGMQAPYYYEFLSADRCPIYETASSNAAFHTWFREIVNLVKNRTAHFEVRVSTIIHQILCEMSLIQRNETENITDITRGKEYRTEIWKGINFIEKHYNKQVTLEQTAKEAIISQYHFARLFKLHTGYSFSEYLIKYRLTQAKRMLMNTDYPISEIAKQTGFTDSSYFSKLFKRYENMSPKQYRMWGEYHPESLGKNQQQGYSERSGES
ncbi:AraC family transcriptional regulator [Paenibacillus filicis]|uniref:AraC family transcriptional regulator n=1 Tax=Paenibacillus gyeongsangnamensis TaxID=3388067 RepID=A0ABT4Q2M7_9BACL|nr:AraC family transcriptional regulator [Paenibacillus filicis]MCZ8510955.1 AraC family transcriptional regulator [Paenibacillus filicis]